MSMEFVEDLIYELTIADSNFQRFGLSTNSVVCSKDSRLPHNDPNFKKPNLITVCCLLKSDKLSGIILQQRLESRNGNHRPKAIPNSRFLNEQQEMPTH